MLVSICCIPVHSQGAHGKGKSLTIYLMANGSVDRHRFDNSVLRFKNMKNIMNFIIVGESEFDQLRLCDQVAGNEVEIRLSLCEKHHLCCG